MDNEKTIKEIVLCLAKISGKFMSSNVFDTEAPNE